jgi:hypothetical protein
MSRQPSLEEMGVVVDNTYIACNQSGCDYRHYGSLRSVPSLSAVAEHYQVHHRKQYEALLNGPEPTPIINTGEPLTPVMVIPVRGPVAEDPKPLQHHISSLKYGLIKRILSYLVKNG